MVITKRKIVQRIINATATPFQNVGDDGVDDDDDVFVVIGGGGVMMMMKMMMLESLLLQKARQRADW